MAVAVRFPHHRAVAPLGLFVAIASVTACDRSEGVHAAEASGAGASRATTGGAPATTPSATGGNGAQAPCVVPTPVEPPPPAATAETCPVDPGTPPTLPRGEVSFPDAQGAPRVGVEIAREASELSRGLMYRTSMPEEQGMLFTWPDEQVRSFWMRNTCIPLDMLFIARDGTIAGIQEQVPVLNEQARSIPCPAAYVLELNAGWCRRHGVQAGMRVVIE